MSAVFNTHGAWWQQIAAQGQALHQQFVQLMNQAGTAYTNAENTNLEQLVLNTINEPTDILFGRAP